MRRMYRSDVRVHSSLPAFLVLWNITCGSWRPGNCVTSGLTFLPKRQLCFFFLSPHASVPADMSHLPPSPPPPRRRRLPLGPVASAQRHSFLLWGRREIRQGTAHLDSRIQIRIAAHSCSASTYDNEKSRHTNTHTNDLQMEYIQINSFLLKFLFVYDVELKMA